MEISKATNKEVPYISVKPCPVCGEHPDRMTYDLGRSGGRGYPGHYSYKYVCTFCQLLKGGETSDIYVSSGEAINLAKELWNDEVDRVQNHLQHQYVPRVLVENDVV